MRLTSVHFFKAGYLGDYFMATNNLSTICRMAGRAGRKHQTDKFINQQMTLTIPITSTTPIAAIQRQFQDRFPYLNLNFFKVISTRNHPYSVKKFCNPAQSLGAELTLKNEGKITITGDMTVAKLMEKMNKEFGIQVQVFRKSANLWMEVALTTSWTLEQQNHHGQEISIQ